MKLKLIKKFIKNLFIKKPSNLSFYGGIEVFNPNCISGWIYKEGTKFEEIRFLLGENLIAKTKINIFREDVCDFLKVEGNLGFYLRIEDFIPVNFINLKPKIIAITNDCSTIIELSPIVKELDLTAVWKVLMKNKLIGIDGYFDGLFDNKVLLGWAGRTGVSEIITIWIQCIGQEPIPIVCNKKRPNLINSEIHPNSGFSYEIDKLPESWIGNEIYCSFDKEGFCKLPQNEKFILGRKLTTTSVVSEDDIYNDKHLTSKTNTFQDLNTYWEDLTKIDKLFEIIDNQITKENKKKNIFLRILENTKRNY